MKHKTELKKGLVRVRVMALPNRVPRSPRDGKPAVLHTRAGDRAIAWLRLDRAQGNYDRRIGACGLGYADTAGLRQRHPLTCCWHPAAQVAPRFPAARSGWLTGQGKCGTRAVPAPCGHLVTVAGPFVRRTIQRRGGRLNRMFGDASYAVFIASIAGDHRRQTPVGGDMGGHQNGADRSIPRLFAVFLFVSTARLARLRRTGTAD